MTSKTTTTLRWIGHELFAGNLWIGAVALFSDGQQTALWLYRITGAQYETLGYPTEALARSALEQAARQALSP